jgi:uncharacterized protein (DUF736 family)
MATVKPLAAKCVQAKQIEDFWRVPSRARNDTKISPVSLERAARRFEMSPSKPPFRRLYNTKEKHMKIGNFTQQGEGYIGSIRTAGLAVADVVFSPMPVKQGSGPDFVVLGAGDDGEQFELGAAWAKTSKKDKPYLSVKLDSPALVQPINCALTDQANGNHALVWNRKDAKADEPQAEAEAAA